MAQFTLQAEPLHSLQGAAVVGLAEEAHLMAIGSQILRGMPELPWEVGMQKQHPQRLIHPASAVMLY